MVATESLSVFRLLDVEVLKLHDDECGCNEPEMETIAFAETPRIGLAVVCFWPSLVRDIDHDGDPDVIGSVQAPLLPYGITRLKKHILTAMD